ncbi:hypothetical protein UFOVP247_22 [uncultured Caudovirales phage]|uniref:Uncharacterized protein n=1 Tax=uncultured Caudovirales phage TaxID=2100421 RepID=A0A6J7WS94_9CAUD|nr:hypothetical protein UFOVP247_22 [uncultured Caudovirales phage]
MQESKTDSDSLVSTSRLSGTSNYSVDYMKKAAFVDELNNVLHNPDGFVDKVVVAYLRKRIREIDRKYK